jgi:hypothetical protein
VVDHPASLIDFLTSTVGRLIGILVGIGTMYTANAVERVDVLNYVLFSIGYVDFPISSIMTLLGGLTALLIAVATVYKTWFVARTKGKFER